MSELFNFISALGAPFSMIAAICLFFAMAAAVGAIAAMVGAIAKEVREFAAHREDLQFKREMLDRGMSVEEIAHLIETNKSVEQTRNGA